MTLQPPPKPYAHETKLALIEREHESLTEVIHDLRREISELRRENDTLTANVHQMTVTMSSLALKVGTLSDIAWKGGGFLIALLFTSFVANWFHK